MDAYGAERQKPSELMGSQWSNELPTGVNAEAWELPTHEQPQELGVQTKE